MITGFIGKKVDQTQKYLEDGSRIPVTVLSVNLLPVVQIKAMDKNGYWAVQIGAGSRKKSTKAQLGHAKQANLDKAPQHLRELPLDTTKDTTIDQLPKTGDTIKATDVLKPGDIVDVTGVSKGKGFAGVVKRHHFKGGPRTHGQSDRERAPGSIGQTTTPGRVYRGKRMAGHMGVAKRTVQNLKIVDVSDFEILIKGLVPGVKEGMVMITKVGEDKKFVPLLKKQTEQEVPKESEETKGKEEVKNAS